MHTVARYRPRARALLLLMTLHSAACADRARDGAQTSADEDSAAPAASNAGGTDRCVEAPTAADRTICPRRLGPLQPSTTRADLAGMFTAEPRDGPVDVGEGMTEPGTSINSGQPDSARIVWSDSTRSRIAMVTALGPAWRTSDGLGVGSSLEEIARALGAVTVLGYGWDYGGTVGLAGTRLERSGIFFRTTPRNSDARANAALIRVRGDDEFPFDDADVRALDPVVERVDVIWR